jgi:hypothetical protein
MEDQYVQIVIHTWSILKEVYIEEILDLIQYINVLNVVKKRQGEDRMDWRCKLGFHCLHKVKESWESTHNNYESDLFDYLNCCRCPAKYKRKSPVMRRF